MSGSSQSQGAEPGEPGDSALGQGVHSGTQAVAAHVDPQVECTPSKLLKFSQEPAESPSDKLSIREQRRHLQPKMSQKYLFTKVVEDDAGELMEVEESVKKVYTSQDSYPTDRIDNPELAKFFSCRICGNFPKSGKFNAKCQHYYCSACIDNFQATVDTTKCPAMNEHGEVCRNPVGHLYTVAGILGDIHSCIRISCYNSYCSRYFPLREIEEHESQCKLRGSYARKFTSISESRSSTLRSDAADAVGVLLDWCEKHKVSPCDFLLFTLKRQIHLEAPELEDSLRDFFKKFLHIKQGKEDQDRSTRITPMMGLAVKLDTNLSHRQYVKLSSSNLLGKLPGIAKVRKAGELLDPGNVRYQVVSKISGEVLSEHVAVPGGGLIDADSDFGHMSFGDLNVNVHGYRASLFNTISKLFEETFPEIDQEVKKNPAALADVDRKFKLFVKVAFDGTSAPVKSDKGASRLSVANWLRGTLCLVAVQVEFERFLN